MTNANMAAAKQEALLRSTLCNRKVLVIHCRRDTAHELEPHDTEFRHREKLFEKRVRLRSLGSGVLGSGEGIQDVRETGFVGYGSDS